MISGKTVIKAEELATRLFNRAGGNAGKTTCLLNNGRKAEQRLFSVKHDSVIGTQITNNMTGTRYFQAPSLNTRNTQLTELPKQLNADGTYGSIPRETFASLLKKIVNGREAWNPTIKSKVGIGRELRTNFDGLKGFFRPDSGFNSHMITCIDRQSGRYHSMTLKQLDEMILKLVEMAGK